MRLLIWVIGFCTVISGCKDDELYGLNVDTRTYLLANKKWQNSAIYVADARGTVIRDEYTPMPDYLKDNFLLLRADSTFELNDGINIDPLSTNTIISSGRWRLIANEQFLKFEPTYGVIYPDSVQITTIDATSFTVQMPAIDGTRFVSYRVVP